VEHEVLAGAPGQGVDGLGITGASQRGVDQGLGFAPGEERRAVSARHRPHLTGDLPDVRGAAPVDPDPLAENPLPHQPGAQVVESSRHVGDQRAEPRLALLDRLQRVEHHPLPSVLASEPLRHLLLDGGDPGVALGLGVNRDRLPKLRLGELSHPGLELRAVLRCRDLALGPSGLRDQIVLDVDQGLDPLVGKLERREHLRLGRLLGAALDHHQRLSTPRHHQVDSRFGELGVGRVHHQLALDLPDPHRADRPQEGEVGDRERRRGADQGGNVRMGDAVGGEHGGEDLGLVPEALGEERADGAVDEARDDDLAIREPPLALEEAPGNLAGRRGLLHEIHGEGKEIDPLPRRAGGCGDEHDGVAVAHHGGSRRLLGHAPGLDRQRAATDLGGHGGGLEPVGHRKRSPPPADRGDRASE
jgi:hypothetical protein